MSDVLTAAQMRAIEQAAIASGEVTGLELMERAGRGVVAAIWEEWPELQAGSCRAVVLCGPGGNGGDGFVVARLLKEWGWEVLVALCGSAKALPPDAAVNCRRWLTLGELAEFPPGCDADESGWIEAAMFGPVDGSLRLHHHDRVVIVDALFGTGLSRPIGDAGFFLQDMAHQIPDDEFGIRFHVVAVDAPSGLCADSGRILRDVDLADWCGSVSRPDLTVTFHRPKLGHLLADGPKTCTKLVVVDIGLPESFCSDAVQVAGFAEDKNRPSAWARKSLAKDRGHKFTHGHALIVSGDHGQAGAARLAARGALRIGAGVVTVASPPGAMAENAARLDAVMLRAASDGAGLAALLADGRINALCLGPGLGLDARAAGLVAAALAASGGERREITHPAGEPGRRVVLDADALTLLARDAGLFGMLHADCVLTPHGGEFALLFPDIAARLATPAVRGPAFSKVDATREAAARAGCVVLCKGADTVIAAPDGRCAINSAQYERAAPWLATAGSGDVLAGFITGLLARGFSPFEAAATGAWLHVECARSFGPGLIAEDLPEELPKLFRALGL